MGATWGVTRVGREDPPPPPRKIQILGREKKGGRMGAFKHLLILLSGLAAVSATGLLSSSSLIPQDLLHYFHPEISDELRVWPGVVERQRREVGDPDEVFGQDDEVVAEFLNDVGEVQEEMCIFHRTRADFTINFETRPGA